MSDIVRDSVLGQIIRQLSGRKYFLYPEERPGFKCPAAYHDISPAEREKLEHMAQFDAGDNSPEPVPSSQQTTQADLEGSRSPVSPNGTLSNDATRTNNPEDLQREVSRQLNLDLTRTKSVPIMPTVTASGDILVDWYDSDDPENPQNWSDGKRAWVVIVLCAYTFVVYTASAIYTTGIYDIRQEWDLRAVDASLPLALYVLAYGIGPLLFSPLSEIPYFGRLPVYAATMVIFVLLSIPTPIVGNFAGLLVLRFLQGFFGSPCLATGGASMQDMYSLIKVPYALTAWVAAAYCGPALGPLISGFAVMRNGWRWSLWPILWASGFVLIFMITLFPETSGPTILYRRARRLRAITGNPKIKSKTEIERGTTSATDIFVDAVIKPFEITIKDPAIAFVNLYTALIYGIYYSFFEAFPIVYGEYYGFSIGIIGVIFTCVLVSCLIGIAVYVAYQYFYLIPDIEKNGFREQEHRLIPALFGCFGPPIGLFIFAWTGRSDIHWIVPTIGITIFGATVFVVMQCIFVYVPFTYPRYAASLFAANDFLRSAMACGSILYATPMFDHLGIGRGTSLLGGLSVMGIIGMFALYHYGAYLRGRSKFTTPPE